MKQLFLVFCVLCFMMPLAVHADGKKDSGFTAEGPFHDFYLGKDLKGYVRIYLSKSKGRQEVTIKITPDVEARLDGKIVPLSNFVMSIHQPSGLHFDEKGKLVRIIWLSK